MCYSQKIFVFNLFQLNQALLWVNWLIGFTLSQPNQALLWVYICDRGYTSRVALKILVYDEISYNLEFSTLSQGDQHLQPYTCGYTYCMWRLI